MKHLLAVEQPGKLREAIKNSLESMDCSVSEASNLQEAQDRFELGSFNLIISNSTLSDGEGTELLEVTRTPVVLYAETPDLRQAVSAIKKGAADYLELPADLDGLGETVNRLIKQQQAAAARNAAEPGSPASTGMIGSCPEIKTIFRQIEKIAPTNSTVLIQGETGTGKELIARAIHRSSLRANQAMICVNCAAIPETLIESELFGYEKGAFTGANTNRKGLIEAADGGTLFLDEIGELPIEAQARLLRFIQEGEIRRIGSVQSRQVDVRLITATHRDLKRLSETSQFRSDLYYRINVVRFKLPPLRHRGSDILEIAETLLHNYCQDIEVSPKHFSPQAIQTITSYAWPGNIREMENAIERAVLLSDGELIEASVLDIEPISVAEPAATSHHHTHHHHLSGTGDELAEKSHIGKSEAPMEQRTATPGLSLEDYFQRFVLEHQDTMNETQLAKKLGVSRKCLWERRQRLGLHRKKNGRSKSRSG